MSIWGKIIGGTAGFALGGPIGAILGVIIGGRLTKTSNKFTSFNKIPHEQKQNIFALSFIILSAKIAKADGQVTDNEILAFKETHNSHLSNLFNTIQKDYTSILDRMPKSHIIDIINSNSGVGYKVSNWNMCSKEYLYDTLCNLSYSTTNLYCAKSWKELLNSIMSSTDFLYLKSV